MPARVFVVISGGISYTRMFKGVNGFRSDIFVHLNLFSMYRTTESVVRMDCGWFFKSRNVGMAATAYDSGLMVIEVTYVVYLNLFIKPRR